MCARVQGIEDLSCGLPPFGRVPGFRLKILDFALKFLDLDLQKNLQLKLSAASCRESSKCKEVIPFYCSSLANPVRLRRTTGNALAVAFSERAYKVSPDIS